MNSVYGNPFYDGAIVPGYDYGGIGDAAASTLGVFIGILIFFYIGMLALGILCYVFQSVGLHSIAKRRGIRHAWLAWIPVGVLWILGSISDQYQYVAKGQVRNRRKILLGLAIGTLASAIGIGICCGVMVASGIMEAFSTVGMSILVMLLLSIASFVVEIILIVYTYIAMYDLYASCNPDTATVFLVLSIFFSILQPFFIFADRKKDLGMPPRREEPVAEAVLIEAKEAPAEETPVEEVLTGEAPIEETPAEETPTQSEEE